MSNAASYEQYRRTGVIRPSLSFTASSGLVALLMTSRRPVLRPSSPPTHLPIVTACPGGHPGTGQLRPAPGRVGRTTPGQRLTAISDRASLVPPPPTHRRSPALMRRSEYIIQDRPLRSVRRPTVQLRSLGTGAVWRLDSSPCGAASILDRLLFGPDISPQLARVLRALCAVVGH